MELLSRCRHSVFRLLKSSSEREARRDASPLMRFGYINALRALENLQDRLSRPLVSSPYSHDVHAIPLDLGGLDLLGVSA
jgi:hypothetical protein